MNNLQLSESSTFRLEWTRDEERRGSHLVDIRERGGRFRRREVDSPPMPFALVRGFFRGTGPVNAVIRADEEHEEPLPLVWKRVAIKRTAKSQRGENVMLGGGAWAGQAGSA